MQAQNLVRHNIPHQTNQQVGATSTPKNSRPEKVNHLFNKSNIEMVLNRSIHEVCFVKILRLFGGQDWINRNQLTSIVSNINEQMFDTLYELYDNRFNTLQKPFVNFKQRREYYKRGSKDATREYGITW